jgi:hypothetical protein
MAASKYRKKTLDHKGRTAARHTRKHTQHKDFHADVNFQHVYSQSKNVDLYKNNFRFEARVAGEKLDLSPYITEAQWSTASSDTVLTTNMGPLTAPVTGSLSLTKPALQQYKQLVPPSLSAVINAKTHDDRWGAVGVVVDASVGWGRSYTPLWALTVANSGQGESAESVELQDGSWTLQLADPLTTLRTIQADFKFTKGKRTRKRGWTAHEITATVCKKYKIPVVRLARGTGHFELTASTDTQNTDPLTVIYAAYQKEMARTGKVFVIKWGPPSKRHPVGGLEVVPLRRNPNLLVMREQLVDAILTRDKSGNFCTVVKATGKLKHAKGKTKEISATVKSAPSIKRFGLINRNVDMGTVGSHAELKILAKRFLVQALVPVRTAELTHPGVATLMAGDAIRIQIPEEGYAPIDLAALETPSPRHSSAALKAAEKLDPTLFAKPDQSLLTTGNTTKNSSSSSTGLIVAGVTNVPDQGIAFVTNIQHTIQAGTYTIDVQTGFTDQLDPANVQEMVDLTLRKQKATKKKSTKKS